MHIICLFLIVIKFCVSDKSIQAVDAFGVRREEFESKKVGNKLVQQVCVNFGNLFYH